MDIVCWSKHITYWFVRNLYISLVYNNVIILNLIQSYYIIQSKHYIIHDKIKIFCNFHVFSIIISQIRWVFKLYPLIFPVNVHVCEMMHFIFCANFIISNFFRYTNIIYAVFYFTRQCVQISAKHWQTHWFHLVSLIKESSRISSNIFLNF